MENNDKMKESSNNQNHWKTTQKTQTIAHAIVLTTH